MQDVIGCRPGATPYVRWLLTVTSYLSDEDLVMKHCKQMYFCKLASVHESV